ncbi:related to ATG4 - essential for autophagy [Ustilago sp. UG-2017a]|nr:related to ATG4 - essential for autophagy [Ustilago sp. UG-2017a]
MTDTSWPSISGSAPNFGPPVRAIPMPDSASNSAPPSAMSSSSKSASPPADLAPRRGIRLRVNSLGTAMMFKQSTAAPSSGAPSSSKGSDPSKLKTRLRSATFRNSEAATASSPSASSAQSPALEKEHGSTSVSSLPLPISSQHSQHKSTDSIDPASRPPSLASSTLKDSDSASAGGPSTGFNRRKFFGRSNSIRSFLRGSGASSAGSNNIHRGSTHPSETSSSTLTVATDAAPQHPLGRLRRMGSNSFLNLNQSKPATPANTSSDDLSSMASVDSQVSRRFSDSLKGIGRRRGKSVSKDNGKSRSVSSQSSSEAYNGRLVQSEMLPGLGSSRRSIESGRSSVSIASPDPQGHSSEADFADISSQPAQADQEHHTSAPRRLTGWLYHMVGSDNTPSIEGGAPLSPVREADGLDLPPSSPTPNQNGSRDISAQDAAANQSNAGTGSSATAHSSAPTRLKAGALFQTRANAGSGKAVRSTQASTGDNTASGSASSSHGNIAPSNVGGASGTSSNAGAGNSNNNGSWVPSGVGFDRAFKFFMDTDNAAKEDEGIWLLGLWHGPRQGINGDSKDSSALAVASNSVEQAAAGRDSEDQVAEMTRAASSSSSISASSPRRTPLELINNSLASSSPAHDRASTPAKESSRVGSSISTAATTSTSDSLRTRSSATSFHAGTAATTSSGSADVQSAFQPDFASRIWCTYRNHFAPISRDGTISEQAASTAEALAAAQLAAATQSTSAPSTPSAAPSSSDPAQSSSPSASAGRGWLGRKVTESNAAQDSAVNSPLGLGAALGAGYANPPSSLGEKMGITNLWSRATAAAQAAGFSRAGLTTDSGWGCMLRTGQSLLANALINVHLGRSWQRDAPPLRQQQFLEELAGLSIADAAEKESLQEWREKRARHATYIKILSWFLDDPSPACPFGVHRMAREGKRLGKEVGEWFGPSTASGAIKQLVSEFPEAGIAVELARDGVFYLDEVRAAAGASAPAASVQSGGKARSSGAASSSRKGEGLIWRRPVLILIGIRLGLDSVNPIYYESVKATFSFPHSVGIAGGRPSSSYYFMGHQGNSLFYLDPHNVRPAVPLRYPPSTFPDAVPRHLGIAHRFVLEDKDDEDEWWSHAYSEAQTSTFHCEKVRRMPIKSLDPSMLLGFLIKDEESLQDLCARIKALPKTIFSFAESAPKWVDDDDFDPSMESFSEPSVGEESDAEDEKEHEEREADADNAGDGADALQRSSVSTSVRDGPAPFPGAQQSKMSGKMLTESQQRTAAWLGHGQPSITNSSGKPNSSNAAPGGGAGIAFPSLDLLSPSSEAHALQRPLRSDVRQVSTSSAATTRPARRPTDPANSRDLSAPLARQSKTSPHQSPVRLGGGGGGADESFSTVYLSDSEVGSAWEEVSDGGTIAPSASAGLGAGLLRTASQMRTLVPTEAPVVASTSASEREDADAGGMWTIEACTSTSDNPVSPISVVSEEELVGVSLDTRASEKLQENVWTAKDPCSTTEGYFGLTSAHKPLTLPRRRSQFKASPVDLATAEEEEAPPVASLPPSFQGAEKKGLKPDLDGSDDDF